MHTSRLLCLNDRYMKHRKLQQGNELMKLNRYGIVPAVVVAFLACILNAPIACAESSKGSDRSRDSSLWSHDNLLAWCVVPFDAKMRGSEERAQMLEKLGFKHFAYDWRDDDIPTFDAEIDALQKHGIDLLAWWFPLEAGDQEAKAILEVFRR